MQNPNHGETRIFNTEFLLKVNAEISSNIYHINAAIQSIVSAREGNHNNKTQSNRCRNPSKNLKYIKCNNRSVKIKQCSFCLLNCRSVCNKTDVVKDFVVENDVDVLAITETWLRPGALMITGDFNLHVDNKSDPASINFLQLLESFDLKQHVCESTHHSGHTLDLIITRNEEDIIDPVSVTESIISDHNVIGCSLELSQPTFPTKCVS